MSKNVTCLMQYMLYIWLKSFPLQRSSHHLTGQQVREHIASHYRTFYYWTAFLSNPSWWNLLATVTMFTSLPPLFSCCCLKTRTTCLQNLRWISKGNLRAQEDGQAQPPDSSSVINTMRWEMNSNFSVIVFSCFSKGWTICLNPHLVHCNYS